MLTPNELNHIDRIFLQNVDSEFPCVLGQKSISVLNGNIINALKMISTLIHIEEKDLRREFNATSRS